MTAPSRDVIEFTAAVLLGTVLGVGLTCLLLSERCGLRRAPPSAGEQG